MTPKTLLLYGILIVLLNTCKNEGSAIKSNNSILKNKQTLLISQPKSVKTPEGMIWVAGKTFTQGAKTNDPFAMSHEIPGHTVSVDGFFIDKTEITNNFILHICKLTY